MQTYNHSSRREISFSDSFERYNSRQHSLYSSPSVAYEPHINDASLQKKHSLSPLHNLHHKYLPSSYKLSLLEAEARRQSQALCKSKDGQRPDKMEAINKKIRNILSEIEEQQSRKAYYCSKYAINVPEVSQYKPRAFQEEKTDPQPCANFYTPTKNTQPPNKASSQSLDKNGVYSNMSSIQSEHRLRTPLRDIKQNYETNRSSKCLSSLSMKASKARTPFNRVHQNKENEIKPDYLSEIDKLNTKIEALNQMKSQINLNFQTLNPAQQCSQTAEKTTSMSTTQVTLGLSHLASKSEMAHSASNYHDFDTLSSKDSLIIKSQVVEDISQLSLNTEEVGVPKVLRKATEKKKQKKNRNFEQQQKEVQQFRCEQPKSEETAGKNSRPHLHPLKQSQNRQETVTGRQPISSSRRMFTGMIKKQRNNVKKEMPSDQKGTATDKAELKRLLRHVQCQIRLDECFRKAKQWFQRLKSPSKWTDLQACFYPQGMQGSQAIEWQKIKYDFTLNEQEENPFYTPRQQDFNLSSVFQAYKECCDYWQANIWHKYDITLLREASFKSENLDLRGRGFISMEDLSRYFNCQLDTYFRNRDVYLVYERLKASDQLYFDDIMQSLKK